MNRKLSLEELNRMSVNEFQEAEKAPIYLVLDNVRSLSNVGGMFRTADAFLVKGIYLCGITAQPPHREIQKTALGATETVAWEYFPDTLEAVKDLEQKGVKIMAVEQTADSLSIDLFEPAPNTPYAFVFGHEVTGVDQEVIDRCEGSLEIPQFGTKHSLNVGTSAGIVLWEAFRKIKRANQG